MSNEKEVLDDWLEFKFSADRNENDTAFVNLKRSEISEVIQPLDDTNKPYEQWTNISMKNRHIYVVLMSYDKVMELV